MATVQDVNANELIKRAAKELESKPEMKAPAWSAFAKTGTHKQRPPVDGNWWYVRAAAVLRTVYLRGPVGTNKLKVKYGGIKNMGYAPEQFKEGSGSVARKALQQLEKSGLIKQAQKGNHKGRIITPVGKKLLDKIANSIVNDSKPHAGKSEHTEKVAA